ncbi:MAG: 6-bladed beta-propeller [Gemmatimonadota bacterium]|nr:6-bladed beta-propeller [Gemmatimonadota bacterium]
MRTTVPTSSLAIAVGTLLVTTAGAADAQERGGARVRVDTLEGGRIVVSNPDFAQVGPEGVPTLVEVLRIGSLDDTCDAFGRIMSLAVDGDGRIYVDDSQANEIRVFSPEGECVRTFGRSGEGPGEFRLLAGIVWQPPGFLWTIDSIAERFTVFDSLGTVLATHPVRLGPAASHPWRMWVDGGGSLHFWLLGFDRIVNYGTGPGLDSLESVPEPEEIPTREAYTEQLAAGGSRISVQRGIPYLPHILWTMNPSGNMWQANSSAFAIHETTYGGDTLRTVRLDREAPRLEGRERDSIADAIGIAARRLPERKRALEDIRTGPDGWVWIETEQGATLAWEVFDARGYYVGRVASPVPIEKKPFPVFGADRVTGVTLGEFDEPYVVQLRIVRGG